MGAIQMGIGTISSALVSVMSNNNAVPMTVTMLCCSATALIILLTGRRILHKANKQDAMEQAVDTIITS